MSKNNYCPSQDWDRYCNDMYSPEPEMTRVERFLKFIGIEINFRLRPTQSIGTQYLNLWLCWGLVQFSLYFF